MMMEEPTLRKAIEIAVETEKLGGIFYRKMANKFSDRSDIAELFTALAEEEDDHERQFSQLLSSVPEERGGPAREEHLAYLKMISRSEFFMGREGLFRNLDAITDRKTALERAFQLEKDTLSFYQALSDVIGESRELNAIIRAEKRHVAKVLQHLVTGDKVRTKAEKEELRAN
jgi:rubrerythrin